MSVHLSSSTEKTTSFESLSHEAYTPGRRNVAFLSRRIEGPIDKPWLAERRPKLERWADRIIYLAFGFGFLMIVGLAYKGYNSHEKHKFCLVWEDNFDTFDTDVWSHDVSVGGSGVGSFEWNTKDPENSWVQDGKLNLRTTLTDMSQYKDGSVVNLTATGECTTVPATSDDCIAMMNSTAGQIINPVKSARLHTKNSIHMKYGKLELRAKIPQADWNWAAFWLMPVDSVYGAWPDSGEIDVIEARGNNYTYVMPGDLAAGSNVVGSALHTGGSSQRLGQFPLHKKSLGDEFHTYGLIWTKDTIQTYVDNEMRTMIKHRFKAGETWQSGYSGNAIAPYDNPFYIILNIAVGSSNGYFSEERGAPIKPWSNGALRLGGMKQFIDNKHSWESTWGREESIYQIDWIRQYSLCD